MGRTPLASQDHAAVASPGAAGSSAGSSPLTVGGGVKRVPKPYGSRLRLYVMHLCFAFVSRMWEMGLVLLIARLTNNSLFFVALSGFLCSLSQMLFMPSIGERLDSYDRLEAVRICLIVKLTVISLAYLLCALVSTDSDVGIIIWLLPLLASVCSLAIASITNAVEKDWLVVLADGDTPWLTAANSTLTQIDLFAATAAPAFTGALFTVCSQPVVAILLLVTNASATVLFYRFLSHLYDSFPSLTRSASSTSAAAAAASAVAAGSTLSPAEAANEAKIQALIARLGEVDEMYDEVGGALGKELQPTRPTTFPLAQIYAVYDATVELVPASFKRSCANASIGARDFLRSGCAGPMLAYSGCYCTVLCFGDIMVVWLRWALISDYWIGVCRGISALSGFCGAWHFPRAVQRHGLRGAGQNAIWVQAFLVGLGASGYFWLPLHAYCILIVVCVLVSRFFLWSFDLAVKQIAQETINEVVRGRVNGVWSSTSALCEMVGYACALALPNPTTFYILSCISATVIFCSALTFQVTNPVARPGSKGAFAQLSSLSSHHDAAAPRQTDDDDDDQRAEQVQTLSFVATASASAEAATQPELEPRRSAFRKVSAKKAAEKAAAKEDGEEEGFVTVSSTVN